MSTQSTPPDGKSTRGNSASSPKDSEASLDLSTILIMAGFFLFFFFVASPFLDFVFGLIFSLSLSTLISLGIFGYTLHRRHERKQEAERKKREMARKKAEWIKARMAEYDAYHARKAAGAKPEAGGSAAVAGAAGLVGATALNDAVGGDGASAAHATGATAGVGDAASNIAAMDYAMRSTEQADHVAESIRNMEANRADFEAQLESEYTAWEAQNLAEDTDMLIGGSGSDGLL